MAIRTYNPDYGGGNDTQFVALKKLLDRAPAFERMNVACDNVTLAPKQGASVNLRRWVNPDVNDNGETEGVTPASQQLASQDYTGKLVRYSEVYESSRFDFDLSPYDTVMGAKDVLQDKVIRTRERIRWNQAVAGTQVIRMGNVANRNLIKTEIDLSALQKAVRSISAAKGEEFTALNNGSRNDNTHPVEPGFLCFTHTDCELSIRALNGFKSKAEFGGGLAGYPPGTFGAVQNIVFVTSPEAKVFKDAGAAVASDGMISTGGVNNDVYPFIVMAKHALTSVGLAGKGTGGFGNASIKVLADPDKSDPTNTRIQVVTAWYDLCMITAEEWMYRIEATVKAI